MNDEIHRKSKAGCPIVIGRTGAVRKDPTLITQDANVLRQIEGVKRLRMAATTTAGGWTAEKGATVCGSHLVRAASGEVVAECGGLNHAVHARLISAAPELLQALERMVGIAEGRVRITGGLEQAKAAIAKAKREA